MPRPPMREDITQLYRGVIATLAPVVRKTTYPQYSGLENIPSTGGFVLAANHVSNIDHFPLAHALVEIGRAPHFLAKSSLFDPPVLRQVMTGTGQIPVYRGTARATTALSAAFAAVRDGVCVCVYPEGTITRQGDYWPMTGKPGAARIALETGCPLVPVAIWGTQEILKPYAGRFVPRVLPRHAVAVRVGPALDLDDLRGQPVNGALLAEVTERLMDAITVLLEEIRGEQAPMPRFDLRRDRPARSHPASSHGSSARWRRKTRGRVRPAGRPTEVSGNDEGQGEAP